ncbi:MAG: helix-turn-helix domain-containing protein [Actinomycetota bacterium]|nr:helix-turn-helix domain-containing protein [Actinomycetota bacterium]
MANPTVSLQEEARALGDPTRHAIFRYIAGAPGPVDIAELTDLLRLNHNAIRQHLAKLVAAGLIIDGTAPRTGRGRPKLVYEVAPGVESRWGVTGPYERLAALLTEVIRSGRTPVEVGREAGAAMRAALSPSHDGVEGVAVTMAKQGFAPVVRRRGTRAKVVLETCPFASTVLVDRETVCQLHLGLAEGLVTGTDAIVDELVAKDPRRAGCAIVMHTEPPSGSPAERD